MSGGHFREDHPWEPTEWRDCGWIYPYVRVTGAGRCWPADWWDSDGPDCAPCGPDDVCADPGPPTTADAGREHDLQAGR